jgi:CheY-like chemotaxis protein
MSAQVVPTTILLAEDDANDVWLISRLLAAAVPNLRLHVVTTGPEAVQYLSGTGRFADRVAYPLPSVILLDIGLPGLDGLEVLRWIRKHPRLRGTVVVILTGSESEDHLRQAYDLHANSFLKKTPLLSTPEVSKSVFSYWLNVNQSPPTPSGTPGNPAGPGGPGGSGSLS